MTPICKYIVNQSEIIFLEHFQCVFSFILVFDPCLFIYPQVCCGFLASTTQAFWHFSTVWLQLRHSLDHHVSDIS